jgi:hypothetical protein
LFDVVPDQADGVEALSGRVVEFPVLLALSGEDRAGVTAAHGDDDVGLFDGIDGEELGGLGVDVDALLSHRVYRRGVYLVGGFGAGGTDLDSTFGQVGQVAGSHLRAAGVVDAHEQDGGLLGHRISCGAAADAGSG